MAAHLDSRTRWSEARRLFHAVVDLDPTEREPVLARYAGGAGVVAEVRSLLDWHLRAPAFLDRHRPSPPEMADPASCTTLDTDPEIRGPQRTD